MEDGGLTGSLREHDVSEARRRRHKSARRAQSATNRPHHPPDEDKERGGVGDEGETSSVNTSSTVSTSARYRRSLRRRRNEIREPLLKTDRDEERGNQEQWRQEEPTVDDSSGLDDTTARITSLLQKIDQDNVTQDPTETLSDTLFHPQPSPPSPSLSHPLATPPPSSPLIPPSSSPVQYTHPPPPIPSSTPSLPAQSITPPPPQSTPPPPPTTPPPPPPPHPPAQSTPSTLALTVHRTDRLTPHVGITHPLVRISLINSATGELVKKHQPHRPVTSYYEAGVDYILPALTRPWTNNGTTGCGSIFLPQWEETVLFNEDITLFTAHQNLLIFELLDFFPPSSQTHFTTTRRNQSQKESWHRIAWGFLRAGGSVRHGWQGEGGGGERGERGGERGELEGRDNVGKLCRLQLYHYAKHRHRHRPESTISEVWSQWSNSKRKPYPSTLYVTLNKATPTKTQEATPTIRSLDPSQPEVGGETVEELMDRVNSQSQRHLQPIKKLAGIAVRLPGHTCHSPTSLHSHIQPPCHTAGCSVLSFSPDGNYLGAGYTSTRHKEKYTLIAYEVSTLSEVLYSDVHRGFIYSLNWSHDSHMICTASADGLVKVWLVATGQELASLPHPCYMYTACFFTPHTSSTSSLTSSPITTLFTGGFDKIVRVWTLSHSRVQLVQELKGHRGHINLLCLDPATGVVYSGDSVGDILVWRREEDEHSVFWQFLKSIAVQKSQAGILSLCLHPGGRRLLVHSVSGRLSMIDLRV